MDEVSRLAAVEALRGPWRVHLEGADVRGFWAQEDAQAAADAFAGKGRPASVVHAPENWIPVARFLDRV